MLLFICLPIIGLVFALIHCYREDFVEGFIGQSIVGILCGAVCALGISLLVMFNADTHRIHHSHWTLYAMHGSSSVSGTFLFGSGSVNGQQSYTYYYIDKDSTGTFYVPCTISGDNVSIYEEDRSDGELEVTVEVFVNPELYLISESSSTLYYAFHIPKGSIVQQFSL